MDNRDLATIIAAITISAIVVGVIAVGVIVVMCAPVPVVLR